MMMHKKLFFISISLIFLIASCNNNGSSSTVSSVDSLNITDSTGATYDTSFQVEAESFADIQILRYQVPGFNQLPLQQKQLAYYLYEAALAGRDIFYDQKSK
jgi:dipeptidyl-peptidase-3